MPIMPHLKDVRLGLPAGQTLDSTVWGGLPTLSIRTFLLTFQWPFGISGAVISPKVVVYNPGTSLDFYKSLPVPLLLNPS